MAMVAQKMETKASIITLNMEKTAIALVILNWNGLKHLETFLPSILATQYENKKVYVIDNASTDESILFLQNNFPAVEIIKNSQNLGYAGGYNQGLKAIKEPFWLLINSDLAVEPNWIEPLLTFALENPQTAALQPKILSYKEPKQFEYAGAAGGFFDVWGYPFCRGRIFDNCEMDNHQYETTVNCFWASGACMFIRKDAFWEVGGFDPDFFAHMEEIDLCWRLQNQGYQIAVIPQSVVYHLGGGSLAYGNPKKTYLNFRNSLAVLTKNCIWYELPFKLIGRLLLDFPAGVKFFLEGNKADALAIVKAHWHYFFHLKKWIGKRNAQPNKKSMKKLEGVYRQLLPWTFYLKNKRTFDQIYFQEKTTCN